jgi:hypothetical protein
MDGGILDRGGVRPAQSQRRILCHKNLAFRDILVQHF